jgi:hypothetical protein
MTRQRLVLLGCVGLLGVLVLLTRWEIGEVPGDYRPFELAATRFWSGDALYQVGDDPFLSPPPFVFFLLPAHALGLVGGYALALFAGLASSGGALWLSRRAMKDRPSIDALLAAGLYLPIWLSAAIGQWGGFFFLVFALTAFFASRGRALEAGLVAALLCAKPTYAPFAIAIVALGLGRRARIGLGIGAIAWLVLSLPLGLESWSAWRGELHYIDEVGALGEHAWQQHTLWGSLRALAARVGWSESAMHTIWLAIAVPLGLASIAIATRALRAGDATRAFALAALATVALNVYLRYYDSQIVLIAAIALFTAPKRSPLVGALALAYLVLASLDAAYFQHHVEVPIEGVLLTAWLGLELRATYAALRSAAPSSSAAAPRARGWRRRASRHPSHRTRPCTRGRARAS